MVINGSKGGIPNSSAVMKRNIDDLSLILMNNHDTPIFLFSNQIPLIERLAEYWSHMYIDGTMFDGGNMVLSCRGVTDNEFMVYFLEKNVKSGQTGEGIPSDAQEHLIEKEEEGQFVLIRSYRTDSGEIQELPSTFGVVLASDILEQLNEEEIYDHIEFVFYNNNFPAPLIMAHLC